MLNYQLQRLKLTPQLEANWALRLHQTGVDWRPKLGSRGCYVTRRNDVMGASVHLSRVT